MSTAYPEPTPAGGAGGDDRSIGQILGDVTHNLTTLVRKEIELAKTELKAEATQAAKGAGVLAGAGVGAHLALIFVSLAFMFLLDRVMPIDLAALLVAVVWGIVAAVLAARGRTQLKTVEPGLPTTTESIKEDAQWLKTRNG